MKRSPLRRISKAQRARNAEWRKVSEVRARRVEWLCEAGVEDVCDGYGRHGHHVVRRSQGGPNTIENCRWVCRACHAWIHSNPAEASDRGLLKSAAASVPPAYPPRAETTCEPPAGASRAALAVAAPSSRPQSDACPTHGSGPVVTSLEPEGSGRFARYSTRGAG